MTFFVHIIILATLGRALARNETFSGKHMETLRKYIMTGHEKGWHHCDVLSADPLYESVPQISMKLENINTLNIKSAFAHSDCLFVKYDVTSMTSLSTLLDFGQKAINQIRLAIVIKMSTGISLEMATNNSNLPFLVAAESENGTEQFLCPVVGEIKPQFGKEICKPSYLEYKNKTLRIGLLGMPPDFILMRDNEDRIIGYEGTNLRLIKMLAEKLKFIPDIHVASSFLSAAEQVSHLCLST